MLMRHVSLSCKRGKEFYNFENLEWKLLVLNLIPKESIREIEKRSVVRRNIAMFRIKIIVYICNQ